VVGLRHPGRQLAGLGLAVTLAHLWLADAWWPERLGEGAADTRPRRIEVAFVRQLAPTAPPAAAPRPPPRPRPRSVVAALAPAAAASAADVPAEPAAVPALEPELQPPLPLAQVEPTPLPAALEPAPPAPPEPAASAAAPAPAFEWPPSTRLTYTLTGNYRGPVYGQAQVEWLRAGTRYQVHMDLSVGPAFAPLMSRRVSSEGEVTPEGLRPRRYDEETRVALREPRRLTVFLDTDVVRLANGAEVPRPAGVQDSASQFVQLTWVYTTRPEQLQPGRSVELPLALPRVVQPWTYDVVGVETLATPAGPVEAVHVKPRREPRPGGDLTAELWVAPSLQYLPVRIVIRQDEQTHIDLQIDRLPEQAGAGR
jgi:hypothetical protein